MSDTVTSSRAITVPLAKPVMGEAEYAAVADVLRSGWVTQGPMVRRFERAVADYVGAPYAVAVSNGTAALHLALRVLDVGPDHEVVVPSLTFIATANAVRYCGATPVFADVDPNTFNIDPKSVDQACTHRTKAIVAVHQFGLPADLHRLQAVADKHACPLIEDAACALGSRYGGQRIGTHTPLACFSFHPRKIITTGEGGIVVTDDSDLAQRLCRLRNHGRDVADWQRHREAGRQRESYVELGHNYRMSDIAAAVGTVQMTRIDELIEARRRLGDRYDAAVRAHPYLSPCRWPYDAQTNRQSYAVTLRDDAPLGREALVDALRERGVAALPGLACVHHEPCYRANDLRPTLPHSERLARRMVLLPMFPEMTDAQQRRAIDGLYEAFGLPETVAVVPADQGSD
ncbi:MAG: DegT/DnrJ/EryC1/StrS family aminotransferase [Phycisphaerales bacterium]|nr:MAG: DegT/DnrJ/EryC1/StrS family aminotransferase [Phycisphaerales bacterium]